MGKLNEVELQTRHIVIDNDVYMKINTIVSDVRNATGKKLRFNTAMKYIINCSRDYHFKISDQDKRNLEKAGYH